MPARSKGRARSTGRGLSTGRRRTADATPGFLDKLEWRQAGPFRGGRVGAGAGDPRDRNTFYFGSTGGGGWEKQGRGEDRGKKSHGVFQRAAGGAVAPSRFVPDGVQRGMGRSAIPR